MMSLHDAARAFDNVVFQDAYGSATFLGQVQLFNESVRSGPASRRRILEVGPDVVIPARKTIIEQATGQTYLVAEGSPDWWDGTVIAVKYPILPATQQYAIKTVQQILLNAAGIAGVWAEPSYIRRVILEDRADYHGGYEMMYSSYYNPISPGTIFVGTDKWYRVRENSREDDIGLGVAEVVQLQSPVATLSYSAKGGKYDPETDTFIGVTPVNVSAFVEPLVLNFEHEVLGFVKPEAGDVAVSVLQSAVSALAAGDRIGDYVVLSVGAGTGIWVGHCRRNYV